MLKTASAMPIQFEFMVDGVATGITFSFTTPASGISYPGLLIFTADLRIIGDTGSNTFYSMETRLRLDDSADTQVMDTVIRKRITESLVNGFADRDLGWRFRKNNTTAGDAIYIQSVGCTQPLYKSGF